ncbi:hypothetical protein FRB93_012451 [Tulasnella sp. JGI-2019a]|nr:hypothetical protein FRB93_012451 [Tulasnella sp. JGI-2019a]
MLDILFFVAAVVLLCHFSNDILSFASVKDNALAGPGDHIEDRHVPPTHIDSPNIADRNPLPLRAQCENARTQTTTYTTPSAYSCQPINPKPQPIKIVHFRDYTPQPLRPFNRHNEPIRTEPVPTPASYPIRNPTGLRKPIQPLPPIHTHLFTPKSVSAPYQTFITNATASNQIGVVYRNGPLSRVATPMELDLTPLAAPSSPVIQPAAHQRTPSAMDIERAPSPQLNNGTFAMEVEPVAQSTAATGTSAMEVEPTVQSTSTADIVAMEVDLTSLLSSATSTSNVESLELLDEDIALADATSLIGDEDIILDDAASIEYEEDPTDLMDYNKDIVLVNAEASANNEDVNMENEDLDAKNHVEGVRRRFVLLAIGEDIVMATSDD